MLKRVDDQVALHLGHRVSDAGDGVVLAVPGRDAFGANGRPAGRDAGLSGQHHRLGADLLAGGQQHCPVHGVFQLADIARPVILAELLSNQGREGP